MIFTAYCRENSRTSLFDVIRIEADSKEEARKIATDGYRRIHPGGLVQWVFDPHRSPNLIPVKNADGKTCAPSQVY